MNEQPTLIVVPSPPAAGKTTIAIELGSRLGLPVFTKDAIKQSLHDSLGGTDIESSRKFGLASFMLLHKMLEVQLSSGRDAIAEMNFYVQHDTPRILSLVSRLSSKLVQVHCSAGDEVLVAGYVARSEAGGRHPAHFDSENIEDLVKKLADRARAHLELNAPFISVDNSDFSDVGMAMVVAEICRFLTV